MVKTIATHVRTEDIERFNSFLAKHLLQRYALFQQKNTAYLLIQFYDNAELSYYNKQKLELLFARV